MTHSVALRQQLTKTPGGDGMKTSLRFYRAIFVCVGGLFVASAFAAGEPASAKVDPRELIGKEVEGHNYPDGWRAIDNPFSDANHSLDGQIIYKKNTRAFVLRKILTKRTDSSPRRTVVIDAVKIRINPAKGGGLLISECKHPGVQEKPNQRIYAEVRFKRCERYSSRISAAWLIDSATQKISPVSPKSMRCVDTFFNNGPDGPKCPPVPAEW